MTDQTKLSEADETGEAPLELTPQDSPPRARKQRRSGGVTIRLDEATSARVDRFTERFCRRNPGIRPERRDILVNLIHRGLDSAEGSLSQLSDAELRALADKHGIMYQGLDIETGGLRRYLLDALEVIL